ncbi:MAG: hypothetical protein ACI8Z9_001785 [Paraglaciecola sp.]|jgi:hypothetical protein
MVYPSHAACFHLFRFTGYSAPLHSAKPLFALVVCQTVTPNLLDIP